jgi:hypothetical protein
MARQVVLRVGQLFGNCDDRTAGVADAVVADRSGEVVAPPDRFTGADDQQVCVSTEAHQDIADVSLGELERPQWDAAVVEYAMYSSPVRLGDIVLRHA